MTNIQQIVDKIGKTYTNFQENKGIKVYKVFKDCQHIGDYAGRTLVMNITGLSELETRNIHRGLEINGFYIIPAEKWEGECKKIRKTNYQLDVFEGSTYVGRFDGIIGTCRVLNLNKECVRDCLRGRQKTHRGYTFVLVK